MFFLSNGFERETSIVKMSIACHTLLDRQVFGMLSLKIVLENKYCISLVRVSWTYVSQTTVFIVNSKYSCLVKSLMFY